MDWITTHQSTHVDVQSFAGDLPTEQSIKGIEEAWESVWNAYETLTPQHNTHPSKR